MDNKNKSQNNDDIDESKQPIGRRHDDAKPNDKNKEDAFNRKDMPDIEDANEPADPDKKRIEINDNPNETERKIPRMEN